jgi:ABC-2 type transport system permease protein
MRRLLWIARHEYLRHVRRRGFLLATLGLPILVIGGMAVLILVLANTARSEAAIGYIDEAGFLAGATLSAEDERVPVELVSFPDPAAAQAALDAEAIAAYVVIPPADPLLREVTVYGSEPLSLQARRSLEAVLNRSLLMRKDLPPALAERAFDPLGAVERRTLGGEVVRPEEQIGAAAVAILGSLLFVITVFSGASYLLQALVEEKENRTMEVVTTSVAPWQLIGGKTLGLGLIGLTMALSWFAALALAYAIGVTRFAPLRDVPLPLSLLGPAALFLILGFLLFAGIMVAISAVVTTAQEGQQFAGVVTITAVTPLMFNWLFFSNPDGALATALSLFPLSAPIAMLLRLAVGTVPVWQFALSVILLAATALLAVWGATRLFRRGMLRYGKRLRLRDVLGALRTDGGRV